MFDKDWWNGNFEENTLTYAEYGHRTENGCLYASAKRSSRNT